MRNLALKRPTLVSAVFLSFGVSGCTATQQTSPPERFNSPIIEQNIGPLLLRAQSASGSFEITAARSNVTARLTGEKSAGINTDNCPNFKRVIESYRSLPVLRPGPFLLLPRGWMSQPMGPTRKDATWWTITSLAYGQDNTAIQINLSGDQGPYPIWADEALAAIHACIATP